MHAYGCVEESITTEITALHKTTIKTKRKKEQKILIICKKTVQINTGVESHYNVAEK